jgi:1-acyl-sn-glycerol-3-phosphate acyltransferase
VAIVLNTVFWFIFLVPVSLVKLVPVPALRKICSIILIFIATNWISVNNFTYSLLNRVDWDLDGIDGLEPDRWLLVMCNHQSWSDILVLQRVFNRKIPFLKFFIKKELIWVPLLGLTWWALDYPFMQRHSPAEIAKDPDLKTKDLETTRKACEKFRTVPVSVMNFVEGTRFTQAKHDQQKSAYTYLLRPKAAGSAFVLQAMGDQLDSILDVTIAYADSRRDLWQFLCGRVPAIKVRVRSLPVTPDLIGDYDNDEFRTRFQAWLNNMWAEKDALMRSLQAD